MCKCDKIKVKLVMTSDIAEIKDFLFNLYQKTGYLSDGEIKQSVKVAEAHMKELDDRNPQIKPNLILVPFVQAMTESEQLSLIAIQFFTFLFTKLPKSYWPSTKITSRIVAVILDAPAMTDQDRTTAYIDLLTAILSSAYLLKVQQIDIVFRMIFYLFHQYNSTLDSKISYEYKNKILNAVKSIILKDTQITTVNEIPSAQVFEILKNRVVADDYLFPFINEFPQNTTVLQVHLAIIVVSIVFTVNAENSTDKIRLIAYEILYAILQEPSLLVENFFFSDVVQSLYFKYIRTMISHFDFFSVSQIASLIDIIYLRYCKISISIINELFVKLLLPYHASHQNTRIPKIFCNMIQDKRMFIDLYNNDPNKLIFKLIIETLLKPVKSPPHTPKYSLICISIILHRLFDYQQIDPPPNYLKSDLYQYIKYDPANALKEFEKQGTIIEDDSESLADFLFNDEKIDRNSKSLILLSKGFKLAKFYVAKFDFTNKSFADSFIEFFSTISLSTRLTSIEFFIYIFAKHFNSSNRSFSSFETVYELTWYSLILNNNLNDPLISKVLPLKDFTNLIRKIEGGKEIDAAVIEELYQKIKGTDQIDLIRHYVLYNNSQFYEFRNMMRETMKPDNPQAIIDDMFSSVKESLYNFFFENFDPSPYLKYEKVLFNVIVVMYKFAFRTNDDALRTKIYKVVFESSNISRKENINDIDLMCSRLLFEFCNACPQSFVGEWKSILTEAFEYTLKKNDMTPINNLIVSSDKLNAEQLTEFIDAFSNLMRRDYSDSAKPSMLFSKLADIVQANTERPTFFFIKFYPNIAAAIYNRVMCKNAEYAKQGLEMLEIVFNIIVSKKDFHFYRFQSTFLSTYATIFDRLDNNSLRAMIVDELIAIMEKIPKKIRYGYEVIYNVLTSAFDKQINVPAILKYAKNSETIMEIASVLYNQYFGFLDHITMSDIEESDIISIIEVYRRIMFNVKPKASEVFIALANNIIKCVQSEKITQNVKTAGQRLIIEIIKSPELLVEESRVFLFGDALVTLFKQDNGLISELFEGLINNSSSYANYVSKIINVMTQLCGKDNSVLFQQIVKFVEMNKDHKEMIIESKESLESLIKEYGENQDTEKLSSILDQIV